MKKITWTIVIVLIILGLIWLIKTPSQANKPGQFDAFAQCIADSGTKFYGAFWCPHCQDQKAEFGPSAKFLPYVECSTSDGRNQTQVCTDAGIQGYPTWVFPDGTRLEGGQSLEELSQKTDCPLPGATSTTATTLSQTTQ